MGYEYGRNEEWKSFSNCVSADSEESRKTFLHDGRRVVVKPENHWADLRIARLLYDVRSPYLPRCFGRTSSERRDVDGRGDGQIATSTVDERSAARFDEERKRLPFVECCPAPATPSIVFEWINGRTMREMSASELSSPILERWFDDVLNGLSWLSQCAGKPTAHLDISPDNIVIADSGDASLIDFSGARVLDGRSCVPETSRIYKEGYAAPEIFLGDLRAESDLYALAMSILSVYRNEPAATLNRSSIRGALRKLDPSFSERLRDCLSEDPAARRVAWRHCSIKPITADKQQALEPRHFEQVSVEEDDHCPYSFATCPFLEVAYILCGGD